MITWTKRLSWVAILSRLARSRRLTEAERDACAAGVDKCSELGTTVDEGRDFIDVIVDEVGAPDGSSLISAVRDLKARAGEREALMVRLHALETSNGEWHERMSVATGIRYESDHESAPGPWNVICEVAAEHRKAAHELQEWKFRAEQAEFKSRPIVAGRMALVRLAFAARQIRALMSEGGGIQSHAHSKPGIWDDDNGHDRAGKPCEQCATVLEFRRAVDELSEPDLVPIHPALVRLAEAARSWAKSFDESPQHHPTVREMCAAIRALPSLLPTVVTCGECKHKRSLSSRDFCNEGRGYIHDNGFCDLGKRRVS